jgi:hypothetical protein
MCFHLRSSVHDVIAYFVNVRKTVDAAFEALVEASVDNNCIKKLKAYGNEHHYIVTQWRL